MLLSSQPRSSWSFLGALRLRSSSRMYYVLVAWLLVASGGHLWTQDSSAAIVMRGDLALFREAAMRRASCAISPMSFWGECSVPSVVDRRGVGHRRPHGKWDDGLVASDRFLRRSALYMLWQGPAQIILDGHRHHHSKTGPVFVRSFAFFLALLPRVPAHPEGRSSRQPGPCSLSPRVGGFRLCQGSTARSSRGTADDVQGGHSSTSAGFGIMRGHGVSPHPRRSTAIWSTSLPASGPTISLNSTAYMMGYFRGGIESVDCGQTGRPRTLGLFPSGKARSKGLFPQGHQVTPFPGFRTSSSFNIKGDLEERHLRSIGGPST